MNKHLEFLFTNKQIVQKIKSKLPYLFQLAELESSRAGKPGMEVGSVREKIITALLIYKFGKDNVDTELSITEHETDVILFSKPVSIKTITSTSPKGVKISWTVDKESAKRFADNYLPGCDMLYVLINWNNGGGFFYIPKEVQLKVLKEIGNTNYIKLPPERTNPRGVEITNLAMRSLVQDKNTFNIAIDWRKKVIDYKPFDRWVELWKEE